jgi:hypothetical protein
MDFVSLKRLKDNMVNEIEPEKKVEDGEDQQTDHGREMGASRPAVLNLIEGGLGLVDG